MHDDSMAAASEPQWPGSVALATAWLRPATTARRTGHVSLGAAFGVHVATALLAFFLFVSISALDDTLTRRHDFGFVGEFTEILLEFGKELDRNPRLVAVMMTGTVLAVEGVVLFLALLLSPWGARDEPVRASVACAVRRVWIQSTQVLPAILLGGAVFLAVDVSQHRWQRTTPLVFPTPPAVSSSRPVTTQAWRDYQRAIERARQARWASQPWDVHFGPPVGVSLMCGVGLWVLWGLFCAVGADRPVTPARRPPGCEACGYDLTGAEMDGRCPECGEPVVASLGSAVRPGSAWLRRRELGRAPAWWQCTRDAVFTPKAFGRRLRTTAGETDHRTFLALHTLPLGLIGLCSVALIARQTFTVYTPPYAVPTVAVFGACVTTGIAVSLVPLAALMVSLWFRYGQRRSVMAAAMQMASYLVGYVVIWTAVSGGLGVLVMGNEVFFRELRPLIRMGPEEMMFLAWAGPNLAMLAGYVWVVGRGTVGARYANR